MGREIKKTKGYYAVHETVSEHEEAITPKFKTEQGLIEHLIKNGTDWDEPLKRSWAEEFVLRTKWVMSGMLVGGKYLKNFESLELRINKKVK